MVDRDHLVECWTSLPLEGDRYALADPGLLDEFLEAGFVGGGSFCDEAFGVSEVDIVFVANADEFEALVVVETGHAVAGATAVGIDEGDSFFGEFAVVNKAAHAG